MIKTALTIAGSDCSGGAGIQADIKTMSALGVYAMSVVVSVVAENTQGVLNGFDVPDEIISAQLDAVFCDIRVDAVKVGMLSNTDAMRAVAQKLTRYNPRHIVIDPVMRAKDDTPLMREDCIDFYIKHVLPVATLLTPNIPEAERISGIKIASYEDMKTAARKICSLGVKAVLVKGGHFDGDPCDLLYDGRDFALFEAKRINTKNTHGTGCTLSSAIASYLALGEPLAEAVKKAKHYISQAIEHSLELGSGAGPLNHFYELYKAKSETKK